MAFKGWIPDCVTLCLGSRSSWVCWVRCWFTGHPAIQWDPFLSCFVLLFIWQLSPQNKWFWEALTWPHAANEYSWGIHGHCGSPGPKLSYWGHGGHIWSHILNLCCCFFNKAFQEMKQQKRCYQVLRNRKTQETRTFWNSGKVLIANRIIYQNLKGLPK